MNIKNTTIETPRLENKKQADEQTKKITELESNLLAEKEKNNSLAANLKSLQDAVAEKNKPETLISEAMDKNGRVDGSFLRYALKVKELANELSIGKLYLRRVTFTDGKYQCRVTE